MELPEKNKNKHVSPHGSSWPSKHQNDSKDSSESYWKYQRNNLTVPSYRNNRQLGPTADPATSYYSSTSTYKHKHHACLHPNHLRYPSHNTEIPHRCPQNHSKLIKSKTYPENVAVVRKIKYKGEEEEKSDEEFGNLTEDNVEDNAGEEEEDQGETGESFDKDYEEQEADDEIDEESDASPQVNRMQRCARKDASPKIQQRSKVLEQQDPRRLRYQQQQQQRVYQDEPRRYFHTEHQSPEVLSEEDLSASLPMKNSSRRSYRQTWSQPRDLDRYENSLLTQSTRRALMKPEIDCLIDLETGKKCSRCGSSNRKSSLRRSSCKFQHQNYPKGSIRNNVDREQQPLCNHCNTRHNLEGPNDVTTTAIYPLKPRRSRDTRSPFYEGPEEGSAINEISNDLPRNLFKCRDLSVSNRGRNKYLPGVARGLPRVTRYAE